MADIASLDVNVQVQIGNLNAQVAQIQKSTSQLAAGIQQSLSQIDSISKTANNALSQTRQGLERFSSLIKRMSTETAKAGKGLETSLKAASQGVQKIATSAESSITKLADSVERVSASITTAGETTHQTLSQILSGVQAFSAGLAQAAQTASQSFSTLAASGQQANKAIVTSGRNTQSSLVEINQTVRSMAEGMSRVSTNLQSASQAMQRAITTTANAISAAVASSNQAVNQLVASLQRLQSSVAASSASTQQAINGIATASQAAATGVGTTATASQAASSTVKRSAADMAASVTNAIGKANNSTKQLVQGMTNAANAISQAVDRLERSISKLSTDLRGLMGSIQGVNNAAQQTSGGLVKMNKAQQDAVSGSANLGRFMRVLTTNILGVNAVAIALGTAIGNLGTQLVSRLVLGIVDSVTQFGRLRNELATTAATMNNISNEMQFVINQASVMGKSIEDAGREWIEFAEQARRSGLSIEVARRAFTNWNQTTSITRQRTLRDTFRDLGTAVGELINKIDSRTGLTGAMTRFFDKVTQGVRDLGELVGGVEDTRSEYQKLSDAIDEADQKLKKSIEEAIENRKRFRVLGWRISDFLTKGDEERIEKFAAERRRLEEEYLALKLRGGELAIQRTKEEQLEFEKLHKDIKKQLDDQLQVAGEHYLTQERINKLIELENQFKAAGIELSLAEKVLLNEEFSTRIKMAQMKELAKETRLSDAAALAQQNIAALRGERDLIGDIILTQEEYGRKVAEIQQNITDSTEKGYLARQQITQLEIEEQARLQQARWDTAKMAVSTLSQIFPKSKAFAIANAIMNTAEGVTVALAKGGPPPYNFIQAALVAAAGVAQIAAIRSANPGGGGSPARPSSGASSGVATQATAAIQAAEQATPVPMSGAIQINIPRGDIWSSERVAELVERINEEVSNGRTLISTRTVR